MALTPRISSLAASTAADVVCAKCTSGILRIWSGTQPATVDTAPTTAEVTLASLGFGAAAFGASSSGQAVAAAITSTSAAVATGTASWFRAFGATTTSMVFDGSVGVTTDFNLVLNAVAISSGAQVSISSLTYSQPKSS